MTSRGSNVRAGWAAALEWAALMIETGYPEGSERPSADALAMTLRAKKGDVDLLRVGMEVASQVFDQRREEGTPR